MKDIVTENVTVVSSCETILIRSSPETTVESDELITLMQGVGIVSTGTAAASGVASAVGMLGHVGGNLTSG
jgi:hypothetical protein